MENSFYVGVVYQEKNLMHDNNHEKVVLYKEDDTHYVDLLKLKKYTTNNKDKEYVIEDSLIEADVNDFNIDYLYLLSKYKENKNSIKKKKKQVFFNKK